MASGSEQFPPTTLESAPIIFISSHGVYDLTEEPTAFVVPDNVYIFETQTIGDVCLVAIDKPLWDLMNNRDAFLAYLKGEGHPAIAEIVASRGVYGPADADDESDDRHSKHRDYRHVFANMHYYKPGDTIYNRKLLIGGGGDGARRTYANMGFYRFDNQGKAGPVDRFPDGPASRIKALQPLRTSMIGDESMTMTQEEMIYEVMGVEEDVAEGGIFIFSSCAAFWKEEGGVKVPAATLNRRIALIEKTQRAQDLALMELTTAGPGGAGANNNIGEVSAGEGRELPARRAAKGRASYAPKTAAEGPDFFENNDPHWLERDPHFKKFEPGVDDEEENEAFANVNAAAAERAEARAAAKGMKAVFIQTEDGGYQQIPTPISEKTATPSLLFSPRDIRDAKKVYGEVFGFKKSKQEFHLLGGGRGSRVGSRGNRRTIRRVRASSGKEVPGGRHRRQTRRRG